MFKKVLLAIIFLIPLSVKAEIVTNNLVDTLKKENIEISINDYEENDKQVPIYFFMKTDCEYCHDFLNYINSLLPEYSNLFKLRSYDVNDNDDNYKIYKSVAKEFNESVDQVPYIVIGQSTFYGYKEEFNEKILLSIKGEYNSKEKYNVIEKIDKDNKKRVIILFVTVLIIVGSIIIFIIIKSEVR